MEARVSCLCCPARGTGAACRTPSELAHVGCLRAFSFQSLSVAVVFTGHGRVEPPCQTRRGPCRASWSVSRVASSARLDLLPGCQSESSAQLSVHRLRGWWTLSLFMPVRFPGQAHQRRIRGRHSQLSVVRPCGRSCCVFASSRRGWRSVP